MATPQEGSLTSKTWFPSNQHPYALIPVATHSFCRLGLFSQYDRARHCSHPSGGTAAFDSVSKPPQWHYRKYHYNPTSLLWQYRAITHRRVSAVFWTGDVIAGFNANSAQGTRSVKVGQFWRDGILSTPHPAIWVSQSTAEPLGNAGDSHNQSIGSICTL